MNRFSKEKRPFAASAFDVVEPIKKQIYFSVKDTGIGIKEEDKSKLFKIFGKIAHDNEINPSGIGLGLTICDKILR